MTKMTYALIGIEVEDDSPAASFNACKWAFDTLGEAALPEGVFVKSLSNGLSQDSLGRVSHGRDERDIQWAAEKIDGIWCIGMEGNLDTVHDATLRLTGGFLDDEMAQILANQIVRHHNQVRSIRHDDRNPIS